LSAKRTKAVLIAAPRSGAGKTTVTLALLSALRARGLAVHAAKTGPDYIDPAFHAAASGISCLNLEPWAMSPDQIEAVLAEAASGADILLVEAAMGLFDGVGGAATGEGAASAIARRFSIPVLLVLDVAGQAQSAAAMVHGFSTFDPALRIAGVILNRVGSERHRAMIEHAIRPLGIPLIGAFPRDQNLQLPERHLGLVQALEQPDLASRFAGLAALAKSCCDLDLLLDVAASLSVSAGAMPSFPPPGQRIALAEDAAFAFVYPHLVQGWRSAGAEIVAFSPLADEAPPEECDSCWLPGGYPELHAEALANATHFKAGLLDFAATRPVHGECGGFMVLGQTLIDAQGTPRAMTGLLSHATSFADRRLHLGYRTARLLQDGPLGGAGGAVRGHEYHYARLIDPGSDAAFAELFDAEGRSLGPSGGRRGFVSGTFFHAIAPERSAAATVMTSAREARA
jgi:cobyrinic acid a,c-diamide synthase